MSLALPALALTATFHSIPSALTLAFQNQSERFYAPIRQHRRQRGVLQIQALKNAEMHLPTW